MNVNVNLDQYWYHPKVILAPRSCHDGCVRKKVSAVTIRTNPFWPLLSKHTLKLRVVAVTE